MNAVTSITVDKVKLEDLPEVASIHCAAFPSSLLTALGPEAVRRYYVWQLTGPHRVVALAARTEDGLVGFCFGGIFQGAMSGFLRVNQWYLAERLLLRPHLLLKPVFRQKIVAGFRIVFRLRRSRVASQPELPRLRKKPFGILSIAVSPKARGSRAAWELERHAAEMAKQVGAEDMELTVSTDNDRAIRFYERNGWVRIPAGPNWSGKMRKDLGGSNV
jgi:ribosomal protein S18 acetylase RimI-like enzyme